MTPLLTLTVHGRPAPQGSKSHMGGGRMVESSKHVKPWRSDVRDAALAALADRPDWAPLDRPLVVDMVFTTVRPRSHYRTGRNAHLLRDTAPARPLSPPDLSKLARSTEDALTGLVWHDDARVVEYGRLAKVYAGEDVDALRISAGAIIRVYDLGSVT